LNKQILIIASLITLILVIAIWQMQQEIGKLGGIYIFGIKGMNCPLPECSRYIEEKLFMMPGITDALADRETQRLIVGFSNPAIKANEIKTIIKDISEGYRIHLKDHKPMNINTCLRYFSSGKGLHRHNASGDCSRFLSEQPSEVSY